MTPPLLITLLSVLALIGLASCAIWWLTKRSRRFPTPLRLGPCGAASRLEMAPVLPFEKPPALLTGVHPNVARISTLTLREAEDLLDWLEQHGYGGREMVCEADELFAVEFQLDDGHIMPTTPRLARTAPARHSSAG